MELGIADLRAKLSTGSKCAGTQVGQTPSTVNLLNKLIILNDAAAKLKEAEN